MAKGGEQLAASDEHTIPTPALSSQLKKQILTELGVVTDEAVSSKNNADHQYDLQVLVAEDNNVNRMVIKGMLKKFGVIPIMVEDGEAAVNYITSNDNKIDLIFMDCEMPIMDGYEATQQIRKHQKQTPAYGTSKIVGLSAHAMADYKEKALASGMDEYLSKPLKITDLSTALERCLNN